MDPMGLKFILTIASPFTLLAFGLVECHTTSYDSGSAGEKKHQEISGFFEFGS